MSEVDTWKCREHPEPDPLCHVQQAAPRLRIVSNEPPDPLVSNEPVARGVLAELLVDLVGMIMLGMAIGVVIAIVAVSVGM